jgi:hypothetical protein
MRTSDSILKLRIGEIKSSYLEPVIVHRPQTVIVFDSSPWSLPASYSETVLLSAQRIERP